MAPGRGRKPSRERADVRVRGADGPCSASSRAPAHDRPQLFSITPPGTEARIATYDPTPKEIPGTGPAYAYLQFTFHEESLLRDALLALCLNRWIDWRGM